MGRYFEGIYYKHQKDDHTVCFIVGLAGSGSFVQVITNEKVYQYDSLAGCSFGTGGISVNLPQVLGRLRYGALQPLGSDIMGPFRRLPMQCSHSVYSMAHPLEGRLTIEGRTIDFTGGLGYMEGDRGRSFPKHYLWLHCSDFSEPCSIMASVAHVPFCGLSFMGCICAVMHQGREYRLATYHGVRIKEAGRHRVTLKQGKYLLDITIRPQREHPLRAPRAGRMEHTIHESNSSHARFQFWEAGRLVFDLQSSNVSFECSLPETKASPTSR